MIGDSLPPFVGLILHKAAFFAATALTGAASLLMSVKKKREFDAKAFLSKIGEGRIPLPFDRNRQSSRKAMRLLRCFISRGAR
jgi:hypothetical protein